MKVRTFDNNIEFIKGFIEALFAEYEHGIGPFMNELHDFSVDVKLKKDEGVTDIKIYYATVETNKNHECKFFLREGDSIEVFRQRVELQIEEIIRTIKSPK